MEPKGIYIRVSTQEQASEEKVSIPNQLRDCKDLCERKGYHVVDDYVDAGYSSKSKDRPEYQRMIADLKAGRIKGVIAWKWDRLGAGRGIYPLMDAIEEAPGPITIETVTEGVISPLMLSMLTSFRAQVLKDQHDRLMSAGAARLEQGKAYGGYERFGYDYDADSGTWAINEEEARWVRLIFQWYTEGVKTKEIRHRLITEGVPQKQAISLKRPWQEKIIREILKNPAYTGKVIVTWGDVPYEIPCPAIVSEAVFRKAQKRMDHNRTWRDHNKKLPYLLSGLLKCAHCGTHWTATGCRFRYKDGQRYKRKTPVRRYRCGTGHNYPSECPHSKSINADLLEQVTWDAITDFLRDGESVKEKIDKRVAELRETREERQAEADRLEAKFNELQQERQWLILQARKGTISQADFEAQIATLDTERAELTLAYQEAVADIPEDLDKLWWTAWEQTAIETKQFQDLDFEGKRKLLETLVDEIVIDPEMGTLHLHGTLERLVYFKEPQVRLSAPRTCAWMSW